jgi:hypothetical protein
LDSRIRELQGKSSLGKSSPPADKAKMAKETGANSNWLEQWVSKFKEVYKCTDVGSLSDLQLSPEVGEIRIFRKRGYGLIGVLSNAELPKNFKMEIKPFTFKPSPKN